MRIQKTTTGSRVDRSEGGWIKREGLTSTRLRQVSGSRTLVRDHPNKQGLLKSKIGGVRQ